MSMIRVQGEPGQQIATFMASSLVGLADLAAGTATVIGVADPQISNTSHDPLHGARAIRQASLGVLQRYLRSASRTVVDIDSARKTRLKDPLACVDLGDLPDSTTADSSIGDSSFGTYNDQLAAVTQQVMSAGALPVLLGGRHENFAALTDSIAGDDDSALLLIAHHLCLPPRATSYPVLALGTNGLQAQAQWNAVNGQGSAISADEIHDDGIAHALRKMRAALGDYRKIHCLLDMAVLDTGHAAGTNDSNIGGLSAEQLLELLCGAELSTRLQGVALANVAPERDLRAVTEVVAAEALVTLLEPWLVEVLT